MPTSTIGSKQEKGYNFRIEYGFGQLGKGNNYGQKIFKKVFPTRNFDGQSSRWRKKRDFGLGSNKDGVIIL